MLDGASRVHAPVEAAAKLEMPALATDHGVMYGAIHFYKACKDAGIKSILRSSEGVPCVCGPMGTSQADGRLIAHNMKTGVNSVVLEIARLTPSQSPTSDIVDVWFG